MHHVGLCKNYSCKCFTVFRLAFFFFYILKTKQLIKKTTLKWSNNWKTVSCRLRNALYRGISHVHERNCGQNLWDILIKSSCAVEDVPPDVSEKLQLVTSESDGCNTGSRDSDSFLRKEGPVDPRLAVKTNRSWWGSVELEASDHRAFDGGEVDGTFSKNCGSAKKGWNNVGVHPCWQPSKQNKQKKWISCTNLSTRGCNVINAVQGISSPHAAQ